MDSTIWCKFWTTFAPISLHRYDAAISQFTFQPIAFQIFDTRTNEPYKRKPKIEIKEEGGVLPNK
jgi:hypothetical protein